MSEESKSQNAIRKEDFQVLPLFNIRGGGGVERDCTMFIIRFLGL